MPGVFVSNVLDLQHQIWMLSLSDELVLAPVKELLHVLDIGTGTVIWEIEYGMLLNPRASSFY